MPKADDRAHKAWTKATIMPRPPDGKTRPMQSFGGNASKPVSTALAKCNQMNAFLST
jgi:hypothetical protein